ncbi:hypothetical protein LPJ66_011722 [Kickxella alabastrina]|uniref:Uncharacterized protein n=1 Tax=Kickxella alabastrina TaxID=61397 RepID=A0ACC1HWW9_9FUNG|nr:hypothetical protein LPJ66_011722 [Kickxella alabastrina]
MSVKSDVTMETVIHPRPPATAPTAPTAWPTTTSSVQTSTKAAKEELDLLRDYAKRFNGEDIGNPTKQWIAGIQETINFIFTRTPALMIVTALQKLLDGQAARCMGTLDVNTPEEFFEKLLECIPQADFVAKAHSIAAGGPAKAFKNIPAADRVNYARRLYKAMGGGDYAAVTISRLVHGLDTHSWACTGSAPNDVTAETLLDRLKAFETVHKITLLSYGSNDPKA